MYTQFVHKLIVGNAQVRSAHKIHFLRMCKGSNRLRHTYQHYGDVIMSAMASQITSISMVCSTVCSGADQRKHQSSASLAFVKGIHWWPVNSPHKRPVTRKRFHLMTSSCHIYACWWLLMMVESHSSLENVDKIYWPSSDLFRRSFDVLKS